MTADFGIPDSASLYKVDNIHAQRLIQSCQKCSELHTTSNNNSV